MALLLPPLCWEALSNGAAGAVVVDGWGPLEFACIMPRDSVSLGKAADLSGLSVTLLCRQGKASPQHSLGS